MSHIAKIETRIQNLECLKKALTALGMEYRLAEAGESLALNGFSKGETIDGCLMEIKTGCAYGIGIRKTETGYEAAADFWAVETFTGRAKEEILGGIMRQYAYETVMEKTRDMGFTLVHEEEDAEANIRLRVRKWIPA